MNLINQLKSTTLGRILNDHQLQWIIDSCGQMQLGEGESLCRDDEILDRLYIVQKGCLKALVGAPNSRRTAGYVNSGETVGGYCLLTGGPIMAEWVAEFDSLLLSIGKDEFETIANETPEFRAFVRQKFQSRLQSFFKGNKLKRFARNAMFALPDGADCRIPLDVATRLAERGENVAVFTNQSGDSEKWTRFPIEDEATFAANWSSIATRNFDRLIFCLESSRACNLIELMEQAHEIIWCFRSDNALEMRKQVDRIIAENPPLLSKIKRICLIDLDATTAPGDISDARLRSRDFIMPISRKGIAERMYRQGVDRVTRHLSDIKIGIALAGGGARGLVHFGVLKALDRAGISFDVMSGTSAGAMFGLAYATGLEIDYLIEEFTKNLTPRFPFTWMRNRDLWFLLWKYRTRGFDAMLRPYLDVSFAQLQIPFHAVTVDLVGGEAVTRNTGDIIDAMLESLNLPGISLPILRDGKALVDGGVLNNLPANILAANGAEFVVGVNVSEGLTKKFGKNQPGMTTGEMKKVGSLETLFRVLEVMGSGTSELQTSAVDLLLTPDTSEFSFTDFTQGAALAEIGEAYAEQAIPEIRSRIDELMRF